MPVIHICAENRAEAVSSGKNGQRAERQKRPNMLKPKLQLNTEHPVKCCHSFVFVCGCVLSQSGRAVITTTCTMSDLPTKHVILHTGLTHTHACCSLFMWRWKREWENEWREEYFIRQSERAKKMKIGEQLCSPNKHHAFDEIMKHFNVSEMTESCMKQHEIKPYLLYSSTFQDLRLGQYSAWYRITIWLWLIWLLIDSIMKVISHSILIGFLECICIYVWLFIWNKWTIIHWGCIRLIKSDGKYNCNDTCVFLSFL